MKTERVARVLAEMKKLGLSQMIITDPTSISYLAVHYENPIERFWALYLREDGQHKLVANRLFTLNDVSGVDILWYTDSEDGTAVLNPYIDHSAVLGIDKVMSAKFLIRLMEQGAAAKYVNGSDCVDNIRSRKDAEEQEKMREASRINDAAMAKFKELVHEVREARSHSSICPSAAAEVDIPRLIKKIIEKKAYKPDYDALTTQLLEEKVSYDTVIGALKQIAESDWFKE